MATHRMRALLLLVVMTACGVPTLGAARAASASGPVSAAAVRTCGVLDMSALAPKAHGQTAPASTTVLQGVSAHGLRLSDTHLYLHDAGSSRFDVYRRSDLVKVSSYTAPWRVGSESFAVDPDGNLFISKYPYGLLKVSPDGRVLWERSIPSQVTGVFSVRSASGWQVALQSKVASTATYFDADGNQVGRVPYVGPLSTTTTDGGSLATDGRYVRRYSPEGVLLQGFGDARWQTDPMPPGAPYHFYLQGSAAQAADGTVVVSDAGNGLSLHNPAGDLLGVAKDVRVGGLRSNGQLEIDGDRVFWLAGSRYGPATSVRSMTITQLLDLASWDQERTPRLGLGAGLTTGSPGNHVPAGTAPALRAVFDESWVTSPGPLALEYTVRSGTQVTEAAEVPRQRVELTPGRLAVGSVDLPLLDTGPGAYEVEATLVRAGVRMSSTCFHFSVGRADAPLDLETLPAGMNSGGPGAARGVVLADKLGTGAHREQVDLPSMIRSDGTLDFSRYDAPFAAAAQESAARGIPFIVQIGKGPADYALATDGRWPALVRQLIGHYAGIVDYWEPFNEPNNVCCSAADYVDKVLKPVHDAARAVAPGSQIVGGAVLGMNAAYWRALVSAGGLQYMDVAAVHPYPGHNRSLEEQGFADQVQALRDILVGGGKPDMPVWVTELAWWSRGEANTFGQARNSARALLLFDALRIGSWSYFISQGSFGDFSALEREWVKPAGVAMLSTAAETGGRTAGTLTRPAPETFSLAYSSRPGAADGGLLTAWTADVTVPTALRVTGADVDSLSVRDLYGAPRTLAVRDGLSSTVALTGDPIFVSVPPGAVVQVVPVEGFGRNVAASAAGATVTASSWHGLNPPARAIDGVGHAGNQGDFRSSPAWASDVNDAAPVLTVTLAAVTPVDRVLVVGGSVHSILPGLRDYDVEVRSDGLWTHVASVRDAFSERGRLVSFPTRSVDALRVRVTKVNFGGQAGGAKPPTWPVDPALLANRNQPWYGPAFIREVEAYSPGAVLDVAPADAPAVVTPAPSASPSSEPVAPVPGPSQPAAPSAPAPQPAPPASTPAAPEAPAAPTPTPEPAAGPTPAPPAPIAPAPTPATPALAPGGAPGTAPVPTPAPAVVTQPTQARGPDKVRMSLSTTSVVAGKAVRVTVVGEPGSRVDVLAYSLPVRKYSILRRLTVPSSGRVTSDLRPSTNTRLYAAVPGAPTTASASAVVTVRAAVGVVLRKDGTKGLLLSGKVLPGQGSHLVKVYRVDGGRRLLLGQVRTAGSGAWALRWRGAPVAGMTVRAESMPTSNNAAGASSVVRAG